MLPPSPAPMIMTDSNGFFDIIIVLRVERMNFICLTKDHLASMEIQESAPTLGIRDISSKDNRKRSREFRSTEAISRDVLEVTELPINYSRCRVFPSATAVTSVVIT
jgi:hypothetical protein